MSTVACRSTWSLASMRISLAITLSVLTVVSASAAAMTFSWDNDRVLIPRPWAVVRAADSLVWSALVTADPDTVGQFVIDLKRAPIVLVTMDNGVDLRYQVQVAMRTFAERLIAERQICSGQFSGPELTFVPNSIQVESKFTIKCL